MTQRDNTDGGHCGYIPIKIPKWNNKRTENGISVSWQKDCDFELKVIEKELIQLNMTM